MTSTTWLSLINSFFISHNYQNQDLCNVTRIIQSSEVVFTPTEDLCQSLQILFFHSVRSYIGENYLLLKEITMYVYCFHFLCRLSFFYSQPLWWLIASNEKYHDILIDIDYQEIPCLYQCHLIKIFKSGILLAGSRATSQPEAMLDNPDELCDMDRNMN